MGTIRWFGAVVLILAVMTSGAAQPPEGPPPEMGLASPPIPQSGGPVVDDGVRSTPGYSTDGACPECCGRSRWWSCGACGCGPISWWRETWDGDLDFGLTGASGNSEFLNIFLGLHARTEFDLNAIEQDLRYFLNESNLGTSVHRLYSLTRYERALPGTNQMWYLGLWYEWDPLRNVDGRVAIQTGFGSTAKADQPFGFRAGLGAMQSPGIGAGGWSPELQLGFDWKRQLTDRQRLFATVDYFPNFNSFSDFRFNLYTGWEVIADPQHDIRIRLAAFDRYATPTSPGFQSNDIDYMAALVWGF